MPIPVFASERDVGLERLVRSCNRVAYASLARPSRPFSIPQSIVTASVNGDQPDLHYLRSVLVTTGWNRNDDVFDRSEVWAARRTPEDKPFNYQHDCSDIIGHITASQVVDACNKPVAEGSDLPAKFHVLASAVLYKVWTDDKLQERMDQVIAEIAEGKWFVSMEVLFKGFDYSVLEQDGTSRVVARNEKTAFLTKHLRAYGGGGVYEGRKIGRVLRALVFSGKGLVRNPANPESIILGTPDTERATASERVTADITEYMNGKTPSRPRPVAKAVAKQGGTIAEQVYAELTMGRDSTARDDERTLQEEILRYFRTTTCEYD